MIGILEEALKIRARDIVNNIIETGECDFVVDLASELPFKPSPRSWVCPNKTAIGCLTGQTR